MSSTTLKPNLSSPSSPEKEKEEPTASKNAIQSALEKYKKLKERKSLNENEEKS